MPDRIWESLREEVEMMRDLCPEYAAIAAELEPLWAEVEARLRARFLGRSHRGATVHRLDGLIRVAGLVGGAVEVYVRVSRHRLGAEILSDPRRRSLTAFHSVEGPLDHLEAAVRQVAQLVTLERLSLALGEPVPAGAEVN